MELKDILWANQYMALLKIWKYTNKYNYSLFIILQMSIENRIGRLEHFYHGRGVIC